MDIVQLDKELRSNIIRPCYILKGPERHLVWTAKRHIIAAVQKGSKEPPDTFLAKKTSVAPILDCLKTPSLLSVWRSVLVEEVGSWKKEEWEAVRDYFQGSCEQQTLILVGESIRAPYLKGFPKSVALLDFKKLYPNQVAGWVNMEVRHLGISISREAANFLVDSVGTDLGELHQALEKLRLFIGDQKLIRLEDVEKAVANTAQKSIFDLTNAIGAKKPDRALKYLTGILEQGEEPIRTLAMISRHFRLLARAQELLAAKGSGPGFAQALKVHPFFAKEYASQARHFKPGGWRKRFTSLDACDRALKSSRQKKRMILERLIWELCRD